VRYGAGRRRHLTQPGPAKADLRLGLDLGGEPLPLDPVPQRGEPGEPVVAADPADRGRLQCWSGAPGGQVRGGATAVGGPRSRRSRRPPSRGRGEQGGGSRAVSPDSLASPERRASRHTHRGAPDLKHRRHAHGTRMAPSRRRSTDRSRSGACGRALRAALSALRPTVEARRGSGLSRAQPEAVVIASSHARVAQSSAPYPHTLPIWTSGAIVAHEQPRPSPRPSPRPD
jgi:hypothetical protein